MKRLSKSTKMRGAIFAFLLAFAVSVSAQVQVQGTVVDERGDPAIGAAVRVQGTTQGTMVDINGNFTLSAPAGGTLEVSFIGYQTQTVPVSANVGIIRLVPDAELLAEVVVFGIPTSRSARTGATTSISGADIAAVPVSSFDQALQGRLAGVQVTTASGLLAESTSVRVRGTGSISISSQPLFVIDGIPVPEMTNLNQFNTGGIRFNPLATINPNDIESVEVLKDAAAAALFGSRAANGVVLITTRRGTAGRTNVSFNSTFGLANAVNRPQLLGARDFIEIQNEAASNWWGPGTVIAAPMYDSAGNLIETDWLDLIFRQALSQNHQMSVSGGTEALNFHGSADWSSQDGIVRGNSLDRYSFRVNVEARPNRFLRAGISASYSRTENFGVLSDGFLAGTTIAAYGAMPNVPERNPDGSFALDHLGRLGWGNNLYSFQGQNTFGNAPMHPTAILELNRNRSLSTRNNLNAFVEITPIQNLRVTSRIGLDNMAHLEDQFSHPSLSGLGRSFNGLIQQYHVDIRQWNWQTHANYSVRFDVHALDFMVGVEYQERLYQDVYVAASDFTPGFNEILWGLHTGEHTAGGSKNARGFASQFFNIGYNLMDRYFIDFSLRADAFSGFGADNQVGVFPGISGAWNIIDENFMEAAPSWLSDLRLRGSWGMVGNSNIQPYASRNLFGAGRYAALSGIARTQVGNANLRWETAAKTNIGLTAGFINNRFNVSFNYWQNNISDMLFNAEPLRITGLPGANARVMTNIGSMTNRGIELQINTTNVATRDLTWTSTFNFTTARNRIGRLPGDGNYGMGDNIYGSFNALIPGEPMGVWRLHQWEGVDPATGRPGFLDVPSGQVKFFDASPGLTAAQRWTFADGTLAPALGTADMVTHNVSGTPTWFGNFDNTVRWRDFDFTLGMSFAGGNKILNITRAGLLTSHMFNKSTEILNRWTEPGQVTDVPRLVWGQNQGLSTTNSRVLERADFLRFRDFTIGYNLPAPIRDALSLSSGRAFVRMDNIFVITGYSGTDPEISTNRNSNWETGWDNRSVPTVRTTTFGVNLTF